MLSRFSEETPQESAFRERRTTGLTPGWSCEQIKHAYVYIVISYVVKSLSYEGSIREDQKRGTVRRINVSASTSFVLYSEIRAQRGGLLRGRGLRGKSRTGSTRESTSR